MSLTFKFDKQIKAKDVIPGDIIEGTEQM
jgi:hypothetical protein